MRDAIRRSPDHLAYRAQEVVKTRNPDRIFSFVRDNFLTRPDKIRGLGIDFRDRVNWGMPGLLRTGIGTAREVAELLKSLYDQAGFKSRILEGRMDVDAIGLDRLYFKRSVPRFQPDESIAPVAEWQKQLAAITDNGKPANRSLRLEPIDFEALGEASLLDEIVRALPEEGISPELNWTSLLRNTFIVGVEVEDKETFANPHILDLPFGQHGLEDNPRPSAVQSPMETPEVKVTLSACTTSRPHERFALVEGSWRAADLVGRQLLINFMPAEEPENLLRMRLGDIHAFIPTLSVQSEGLSEDDVQRLSFGGDLITVQGDRIKSEGDRILVNNKPLPAVGGNPDHARRIARMELEAEAGTWPEIVLRARVLDDTGQTVPDLPASCFRVSENERPAPFLLLRNNPEPPRILLVFDYSGSMKPEFRGKGLAPLVHDICVAAQQRLPGARFQLAVISYDTSGLRTFSPWLDQVDEAQRLIEAHEPGGLQTSNYWSALATATNKDANLVVLFTDADGSEEGSLQQRATVMEGCPAVVIGVPSDKTREDHLASLAAASGGAHILVDNHSAAVAAVVGRLEQDRNWPYLLRYTSPVENPEGTFRVRIETSEGSPHAEASYEVEAKMITRRSFAGLYLEVRIGDQHVLRTLAGMTPWNHKDNPVTEAHARESRHALLGDYQISFEGEAPTTSALLDTILGSFLSLEPLARSLPDGSKDAMLEALGKGVIRLAPQWKALNARLADPVTGATFTYQEGWRAVLFSSIPREEGPYLDRSDVLSFTTWRTVAEDAAQAWRTSLAHSLRLSLVEAANYDLSTASVLQDKPLVALSQSEFSSRHLSITDPDLKRRWTQAVHNREPLQRSELVLASADLQINGYWSVNTQTGSILGFLPTGAGGGERSDTERYFNRVDSGLQAFDKAMSLLGLVSPAFGVWVKIEQIKVAKVKLATILLLTMDGSIGIDDFENQLREEATGWARDIVLDAAGNHIPAIGSFNDARNWYELATGVAGYIGP